jgi:uncharacterized SAM-binding protein YcdF (DUF218 family)
LVFGCPAFPDGTPRPPLARRLQRALEVARRFPYAQLVLSGGAVLGPVEAEVMARWLEARGVASARLHLEPVARDTADNAWRGVAMASELGAARITVVTERFHAWRAQAWVRLAVRKTELPASVDLEAAPDDLGPWRRVTRAVAERIKWWSARLRSRSHPNLQVTSKRAEGSRA